MIRRQRIKQTLRTSSIPYIGPEKKESEATFEAKQPEKVNMYLTQPELISLLPNVCHFLGNLSRSPGSPESNSLLETLVSQDVHNANWFTLHCEFCIAERGNLVRDYFISASWRILAMTVRTSWIHFVHQSDEI